MNETFDEPICKWNVEIDRLQLKVAETSSPVDLLEATASVHKTPDHHSTLGTASLDQKETSPWKANAAEGTVQNC